MTIVNAGDAKSPHHGRRFSKEVIAMSVSSRIPNQSDPKDAGPFDASVLPYDFEPVFAANQQSMKVAAEAQAHLAARLMQLSSEFFGFVDKGFNADCVA